MSSLLEKLATLEKVGTGAIQATYLLKDDERRKREAIVSVALVAPALLALFILRPRA